MSDATEDLAAAEEIEHAESDYERQRLINIQRNNAILQVLPPVRHAHAHWRHVKVPHSYTLPPKPYIRHPAPPYTLNPTPYTLYPTPYTLPRARARARAPTHAGGCACGLLA